MFIIIGASRGFYSPSTPTIRISIPCHLFHWWIYTYFLYTYWVPSYVRGPSEGHSIGTEQLSGTRPGAIPQQSPSSLGFSLCPANSYCGTCAMLGLCLVLGNNRKEVLRSSRISRKTDKQITANPELIAKQAEQWSRGQWSSASRHPSPVAGQGNRGKGAMEPCGLRN